MICPLCNRKMIDGPSTDRHHLIPKSLGGKELFLLHKTCYRKIHSLFSERELQKKINNWEILKNNQKFKNLCNGWLKKLVNSWIKNYSKSPPPVSKILKNLL